MRLLMSLLLATMLDNAVFTLYDNWYYDMKVNGDHIYKEYKAVEMAPHTAILCPDDFFISRINYEFEIPGGWKEEEGEMKREGEENEKKLPDNKPTIGFGGFNKGDLNLNDSLRMWSKIKEEGEGEGSRDQILIEKVQTKAGITTFLVERETERIKGMVDDKSKHGPCPTLLHCVGFQACLFRFGIEFCRNDPFPRYRKLLQMRLTCSRRKYFSTHAFTATSGELDHVDPEQTIHLKYKSRLAVEGVSVMSTTNITRVRRHNMEVFRSYCPTLEEAKMKGYKGSCNAEPRNKEIQTNLLWTKVARTMTPECSKKMQQVFCAYEYNRHGDCFPPSMTKQEVHGGQFVLSNHTLPENGPRPDLSSYQRVLNHPHSGLIPARLAFVLMIHSSPEAMVQLLRLIYRQQFYYVIHIDARVTQDRVKIQNIIVNQFPNATNIRVLPIERSFESHWGSFGIIRAELEAYEELLRMGVWDFSVLLSGSDLPIRSVDDLAASLAPYRGSNFIQVHSKMQPGKNHVNVFWHSCDNHLFEVGSRAPRPDFDSIYSHSNWAIFSREATDLLISRSRPSYMNRLHFYMSSSLIPDELYAGSYILSSNLKNTYINYLFHYLRRFEGTNWMNLCRHSEETDTCGQGPGNFVAADKTALQIHSHRYFFARKFKTSLSDDIRQKVVEGQEKNEYHSAMAFYFTPVILRELANLSVSHLPKKLNISAVKDVSKWHIVPRLLLSSPCCRLVAKHGNALVDEFLIWIDYMAMSNDTETYQARATLRSLPTFGCYPGGSIRMMHVTTRADILNAEHKGPLGLNLPIPTVPAGGTVFWIQLFIDLSPIENSCAVLDTVMNPERRNFVQFPPAEYAMHEISHIVADVTVWDMRNVLFCAQEIVVDVGPKTLSQHAPVSHYRRPVNCPTIVPGIYRITMQERNVPHPFVYTVMVTVVEEPNVVYYEEQALYYLKTLWRVNEAMIVEPTDHFYISPTSEPRAFTKAPRPTKGYSSHITEKHADVKEQYSANKESMFPLSYPGMVGFSMAGMLAMMVFSRICSKRSHKSRISILKSKRILGSALFIFAVHFTLYVLVS